MKIRICVMMVIAITSFYPLRNGFAQEVIVEQNLTYGQVEGVELKLDLARPKTGDGPFPAIVFIHGGAWAGGKRTDYQGQIEKAARKGYVAATISYRLTEVDLQTKLGKVPFPAQIQDCKCAIRWLRSEAARYQIAPDRIGVTGGSAGGHLSLLVGMAEGVHELEGDGGHSDQSSRVQAVVNYCGPTDLAQEYHDIADVQIFLHALCGGTPDTAADRYRLASPITYVSGKNPPVLTLHGDQDTLVLVSQAKLLDQTMKQAGASHELILLEGMGHAFEGEQGRRADRALWEFLEKHLKPKTP